MQISLFPEEHSFVYDIQFYFPEKENTMLKLEKANILKSYNDELEYIHSHPHISLASFVVAPSRAHEIINNLKATLLEITPLEVNFNNFVCYDSNHLIFAEVEPESQFVPILKALTKFKKDNNFPSKYFTLHKQIHATVAIPKEKRQYELISNEYNSKKLHSVFILDKILIRKSKSNSHNYEFETIKLNHQQ